MVSKRTNNYVLSLIVIILVAVRCVEGSVPLQNPDASTNSQLPAYDLIKDQVSRGIVEVCINQSYSTVLMDNFWSDEDASVICRQLGFSQHGGLNYYDVTLTVVNADSVIAGSIAVAGQVYEDSALEIINGISHVQCDGSEMSLLECSITPVPNPINSAAVVVCQAQSTPISNCSNGDIRLVNGTTVLEGRLEICINNAWGTVCSQGFTADDAEIVCRQLKLPFNGVFICNGLATHVFTKFPLHIRFDCVS